MNKPTTLLDLSLDELQNLFQSWGEPPYRARQVWSRLYLKFAASLDEMTELSKALREKLAQETVLGRLTPHADQHSSDGQTRKLLFVLPDGAQVESVLMSYERRRTTCISTQAGCAMNCSFCATGQGGFQRNLTSGEIVEQVLFFARELAIFHPPSRITNIVFMGMGEPFANYDHVMTAVRRLNDPQGFNLGARRMTLSTVGLVHGIRKLASEDIQINLAVSLHAATDELRNQLVPINKRYPLSEIMPAVQRVYRTDTSSRKF